MAALYHYFIRHIRGVGQLRDSAAVGTGNTGGDTEGDAGGSTGGDIAPFGASGLGNSGSGTLLQLLEIEKMGQGGGSLCGDWG